MKKSIIGVIAAVLFVSAAGAGYFSYKEYQQKKFVASLVPHVKNSSLRVSNTARYAAEDGGGITFKELFDKLEADIAEIDKRLIEVQTLSTPETKTTTDPTVAYLTMSQEYLRALLAKYRKTLAFSSASDQATDSIEDMKRSNGYAFEYASKAADRAIAQMKKTAEENENARKALLIAAGKMQESRNQMKAIYPEDALIQVGQLDAIIKKNSPEPVAPAAKTSSPKLSKV